MRRLFVAHPMQEDAVLNHGPMCPCCGNLNPAATAYFTPTSEMSYVIPGTGEESTQAQVGGRWSSTATNGNTGSQGNPITLTYSFVPDGTPIANGANSSLFSRMRTIFGTNDDSIWQNFLGGAITSWGAQAGITYVREMNDNGGALGGPQNNGQLGVRGDVRIGGNPIDGNSGVLAYNYFPGDGGDMVLDTSDNVLASTSQNRRALYNIVAHEHGHGIGLNHVDPADGTKLMEPFLDTGYFGQQFDDLLGAMVNYNDRLERTGRNDTIGAATNLGAIVTGSTSTTNIAIVRNADTDMFKFTLSESGNFGATVTPTGPTYLQGPQNGTTSSFNAKTQKNLQVSVLNSAGTVLATANATGAGVAESLSGVSLGAGTYYVRVQQQSSDNNTQIYTLGTSFTAASILTASTSTITSPRVAPVDSITITFNNTLQAGTFTMADLTLERDGLIESLAGATLNTSDN
ncbi:MAG TPA: matrixin family metalloprotease, partial [Tepidisphaeraceae bacterium]|nr:matrixin family metalloprotease [Tepidisphaeraceae bacterium]